MILDPRRVSWKFHDSYNRFHNVAMATNIVTKKQKKHNDQRRNLADNRWGDVINVHIDLSSR